MEEDVVAWVAESSKQESVKGMAKKTEIIIAVLVILTVTYLYFEVDGLGNSLMPMKIDPLLFNDIKLKVAFKDEQMKIFAFAKNNGISMLPVKEGNSIPEKDTIVLGYSEAMMMKNENLIKGAGNNLNGFFGIDTKVEGILRRTNSFIDDFHFLSYEEFKAIQGQENKAFIKMEEDSPEFIYTYRPGEILLLDKKFVEGNLSNYKLKYIDGEAYYPIILGYTEGQMMKSEKEFSKPGDTIKGFFGKNLVVAGVLNKTNSALDMMHIVPLTEDELGK
jgi:hypothetical protein